MPLKVKINKQMIIDAAFDIVKNDGIDKLNARTIFHSANILSFLFNR